MGLVHQYLDIKEKEKQAKVKRQRLIVGQPTPLPEITKNLIQHIIGKSSEQDSEQQEQDPEVNDPNDIKSEQTDEELTLSEEIKLLEEEEQRIMAELQHIHKKIARKKKMLEIQDTLLAPTFNSLKTACNNLQIQLSDVIASYLTKVKHEEGETHK